MTQDRYGNIHRFEIAQLSVHVDDLRQRRDAEAGGAFDGIGAAVEKLVT